jgi:acyl-coenzyme A synthetase/AMP-(fatty) acid ligase
VAPHKRLADVVSCDVIPKNPSGKLLRRVLQVRDAERLRAETASA